MLLPIGTSDDHSPAKFRSHIPGTPRRSMPRIPSSPGSSAGVGSQHSYINAIALHPLENVGNLLLFGFCRLFVLLFGKERSRTYSNAIRQEFCHVNTLSCLDTIDKLPGDWGEARPNREDRGDTGCSARFTSLLPLFVCW